MATCPVCNGELSKLNFRTKSGEKICTNCNAKLRKIKGITGLPARFTLDEVRTFVNQGKQVMVYQAQQPAVEQRVKTYLNEKPIYKRWWAMAAMLGAGFFVLLVIGIIRMAVVGYQEGSSKAEQAKALLDAGKKAEALVLYDEMVSSDRAWHIKEEDRSEVYQLLIH